MLRPGELREGLRALKPTLQALRAGTSQTRWAVVNTRDGHAIAVGLGAPPRHRVRRHGLLLRRHEQPSHDPRDSVRGAGRGRERDEPHRGRGRQRLAGRRRARAAFWWSRTTPRRAIEKEVRPEHLALLDALLRRGEASARARLEEFRRHGLAWRLYTFSVDNAGEC